MDRLKEIYEELLFKLLLKIVTHWKCNIVLPNETYAKGDVKWMKIVFPKENRLRNAILSQLDDVRRAYRK